MGKEITLEQVNNIKQLKAGFSQWILDNWDYDKKTPEQKEADKNKQFPERMTGDKNYSGMIYTMRHNIDAKYLVMNYNHDNPADHSAQYDAKPDKDKISDFAQEKIALYAAAKETLSKRPWWRFLIHPIDSYNENKELNDLGKEITKLYGINEKTLQDVTDVALNPNKKGNEYISFDKEGIGVDNPPDELFEDDAQEPILPSKNATLDENGEMVFDDDEPSLEEQQKAFTQQLGDDTTEVSTGAKSSEITNNEPQLSKNEIDI